MTLLLKIWLTLLDVVSQEGEMGRNITRAHIPFLATITVETVETTWGDVILGIGDINVLGNRVNGD